MHETRQAFDISGNVYEDMTSILLHGGSRLKTVDRRSSNLDHTLGVPGDCTKIDGTGQTIPWSVLGLADASDIRNRNIPQLGGIYG